MLDNNSGHIIISVGYDPLHIPEQPETVNLDPNQTMVTLSHNLNPAVNVAAIEQHVVVDNIDMRTVVLSFQENRNPNDFIINKSADYSAVSIRGVDQYQRYNNGDFVEFSEEFKNKLVESGNNYPMFFNVIVDATSNNPIPLTLQIDIPTILTHVNQSGFDIESSNGLVQHVREQEFIKEDYQHGLSTVTILDTVI